MSKREALLEAAACIVVEQGTDSLTLDSVAQAARVSKGGLLYHFPSRDALIEGLQERIIAQVNEQVESEMEAEMANGESPEAGRWLRAYVRAGTAPQGEFGSVILAMFAVGQTDTKYLSLIRRGYREWEQRALDDGVSRDVAELVCMATDGCWLYGLYHEGQREENRLTMLRQTLLGLIESDLNSKS